MDDKEFHSWLMDMFCDANDASDKSRRRAERDIDYYNGRQLTEAEVRELKKRGQPPVTLNMIRNKIDYLQGLERQQRTKPRALPRTPMHEQDSEGVTDSLRYVCEDQAYDDTKSKVWADLLKAGWGGFEITVAQKANKSQMMASTALTQPEYDVIVTRCPWDRMFWDPHSAEEDYSDATYQGLVIWMDRSEAVRRYGEGAAEVFDATINITTVGDTFDDKPKFQWVDNAKRKRIRVIQIYYIDEEGQWSFAEYTRGGILQNGPSPFLDEDGERENAFCWRSAYVDRDNNRYGAVRDLIDPQDEINKRKSKSLHFFTSRQTYGNHSFANTAENKRQLQKPDGHVTLEGPAKFGEDFGIIPTNDQAQGHMEHLQLTMSVFETMGPNAAMQGKQGSAVSGRAIALNQQGGQTQMGLLTDSLRQMDIQVYRKMWNRIRQFWTGERWIRVTDDQRNMKWVGINPAQQYDPDQLKQQTQADVAIMQNPLGEIDVDFILDEAPAVGTLMDEQFALLIDLKNMDTQGEIPFKAVIAAAPNLRNKAELIKAITEKESQPPNPLQVAGAEAELAEVQASAKLKEAQAMKAMSDAAANGNPQGQQGPTDIDVAQALAEIRFKDASTMKTLAETEQVQVETDLAPQKMAHDAHVASQRLNSGAGSNGQSATVR